MTFKNTINEMIKENNLVLTSKKNKLEKKNCQKIETIEEYELLLEKDKKEEIQNKIEIAEITAVKANESEKVEEFWKELYTNFGYDKITKAFKKFEDKELSKNLSFKYKVYYSLKDLILKNDENKFLFSINKNEIIEIL